MSFKFTKEQLSAIYNGDMDARNTFYFDNLDIIKRMARNYASKFPHSVVSAEDLVQGVYVDMDYFCNVVGRPVCDWKSIAGFMHWSFRLAPYGGLACCREHNKKITSRFGDYFGNGYMDPDLVRLDEPLKTKNDNGTLTYGDTIVDSRIDLSEDRTDYIDEYVKTFGKYLTPTQCEVFSLVLEGYKSDGLTDKLSRPKTVGVVRKMKQTIFYRFFRNIEEVMKDLERFGISAPTLSDSDLQRIAELINKRRSLNAEYQRRNRERNPEGQRERNRRYKASHPEAVREANRIRMARKRAERKGNGIT